MIGDCFSAGALASVCLRPAAKSMLASHRRGKISLLGALVCAVILLQGALIFVLLYQRRRRPGFSAEVQSRQRSAELAHINRY
jgi:hypothetical protein